MAPGERKRRWRAKKPEKTVRVDPLGLSLPSPRLGDAHFRNYGANARLRLQSRSVVHRNIGGLYLAALHGFQQLAIAD